ncbi:MAG: 4-hydroxybenzoate octaprenyltransferase [Burkholderiaceae bacterium]
MQTQRDQTASESSAVEDPPAHKKNLAQLYLDLVRWDRPAGWLLLLWPTLSGLWVAKGGWPGWHLLIVFVLGTILMRSAGCCLNDVADKEFDRHVKRTASRPVTRGLVSVKQALALAVVLALLAFGLVCTLNAVTVAWSFVALGVTLLYPYAKRVVSMPQAVLGVAFSFGIPMAFAAVQGDGVAWIDFLGVMPNTAYYLLMGNMAWVLAYDTQYAMVDRDDDKRIGMKTSAITLGEFDVLAVACFYVAYLLSWALLLRPYQLAWPFDIGLLGAAIQALFHCQWIKDRSREGCFKAFRLNHWLGASIFMGVAFGFILK